MSFSVTSELFRVPQNETSNLSCVSAVSFYVYTATTSAALSSLPTLARTNADFTVPSGVTRGLQYPGLYRTGNTLTCSIRVARTNLTGVGSTMFYRIAKRIDNPNGVDGTVFTATTSFVVPPTVYVPPSSAPTVNAGVDQTITRPASTVSLTGTAKPNGGRTISSTLWTMVSGPNAPTITTPAALSTTVTGLVQGTYEFRLRAIDSGGSSGSDRMIVTVAPQPAGPDLFVSFQNPFFSGATFIATETGPFHLCEFATGANTKTTTLTANLVIRVTNGGTTATPASCTLSFAHGNNPNLPDRTFTVGVLQPGAFLEFNVPRTLRDVCATKDNVGACVRCTSGPVIWNDTGVSATVDSGGVITESNESNNSKSLK